MKDLILQVSQMEELPAVVSRDIEVVYVLRGEITLLLGESHYQMKAEDVIVVNSGAERGWKNGQGCLLVRIRIRYGSVTKMTGRPYVKFWCNSVINGGHDVAGLRVLLSAQKTMNKQGSMIILNTRPEIMDIFEITRFTDILNIQ